MRIALDPRRTATVLMAIVAVLFVAHLFAMYSIFRLDDGYFYGFVRFFNLDQEPNVPTFFSALLLLSSSLLLAAIGHAQTRAGDRFAVYWWGLALVFGFLAIDEAAAIHEEVGYLLIPHLETSGLLYYRWILPYGTLALVVLLLCARFLLSLPARTRNLFLAAGAIYVTGALGFEAFQGRLDETDARRAMELRRGGVAVERDPETFAAYGILATCEEVCEMVGIVVFLYALLAYARDRPGGVRVTIDLGGRAPPAGER